MDAEKFGAWLKDELDKRNMTCYQLSKLSGLTQVTLLRYIRCNRNPSLYTMNVLLNALGKHLEIVDN